MRGDRPNLKGLKKVRKPRGIKLNGHYSMDMCTGCIAFGCDPMAMSRAFQEKKARRDNANVCVSCGNNPCKCKSSLDLKPQTISKRQSLISIHKENIKESLIRRKYFSKNKPGKLHV